MYLQKDLNSKQETDDSSVSCLNKIFNILICDDPNQIPSENPIKKPAPRISNQLSKPPDRYNQEEYFTQG
ncbi:unnamed protein product [Brachionus calyciflorus]|uniref:Uncharacterized protein n=1 Tax=Brachionus calyciflorus TaxID=104777 RepID=A0A814H2V3_9BILA|nr:unnamed protein product [Brachionus calyciflorus]